MASKFNYPGLEFEVTQKDNVPEVHVHVKASWVSYSTLNYRIRLSTKKVLKILREHYDYHESDLGTVKDDYVTNLEDNTEEQRTGHWVFSLPKDSFEDKAAINLNSTIQSYVSEKWEGHKDEKEIKSSSYSKLLDESKITVSEVADLLNNKLVEHPRDKEKYKAKFYHSSVKNLLGSIDEINTRPKKRQSNKSIKKTTPTLKKEPVKKTRSRKRANLTK